MERKIRKICLLILIILCFFGTTAFTGCKTNELSSLYSLTDPQQCTYECESATLEGKDILSDFKLITLELKKDGTFILKAKPKIGPAVTRQGNYTYNENEKIITMSASHGKKTYKKAIKLEKGRFTVSQSLGGRELIMKFSVKA